MSRTASVVSAPLKPGGAAGYFQRSERPLLSLIFILPLVVAYELGTPQLAGGAHPEQRIIAFNLMQQFFAWFGASGRHLPALAVVVVLLAWHVARQDSWRVEPGDLLGILAESLLLAVPLVLLGLLATQYMPLSASGSGTANLVVLSLGAGIYEELVFRLVGITVLSLLLVDLVGVRKSVAVAPIVVMSALMFAAYHYLGSEPFRWGTFAFRTAAGVYFGVIFLFRGFGITAGCHIAYDLLIVVLRSAHEVG